MIGRNGGAKNTGSQPAGNSSCPGSCFLREDAGSGMRLVPDCHGRRAWLRGNMTYTGSGDFTSAQMLRSGPTLGSSVDSHLWQVEPRSLAAASQTRWQEPVGEAGRPRTSRLSLCLAGPGTFHPSQSPLIPGTHMALSIFISYFALPFFTTPCPVAGTILANPT